MPEGDTVWLTAHRLNRALAGRPLVTAQFRVPQLATADVRGRVVSEVLARGKHLLVRLEPDLTLHSHLRMDGTWHLSRASAAPPTAHPDHMIRVLLANDDWRATGYRIHDLTLLARDREDTVVGHLGPDLLGPDWNLAAALERLRQRPERPIGEALLDQRNLAGIGNMYKCEALFVCRLHPWLTVEQVDELDALETLVTTAHRMLRLNRDHPEQSTTGLTGRGREHWVYGRGGQPCLRCRTIISTAYQGPPLQARITHWCPTCQPGPDPNQPASAGS